MVKLVKESLNEKFDPTYAGTFEGPLPDSNSIKEDFAIGDLVRWSHRKNQIGLPTLYGMLTDVKKNTVSIVFLGQSNHDEIQPTTRNETWIGGKYVPWEGHYTKEELADIADYILQHKSPGEGYPKKYLTIWNPEE